MSKRNDKKPQDKNPATNKPVDKPYNIYKPNTDKPRDPKLQNLVEKEHNPSDEKR